MASFWQRWRTTKPLSEETYQQNIDRLREKAPIPTLWLFGKTGSGKSSVIRYLTKAEEALVGEGYKPETKRSRRFDFPNSNEPLLTFLDTRGLGEATYDPREDIDRFAKSSQLMIVTVRVADHALEGVIEPLRKIRTAASQRPVLLVLTCLHEAMSSLDITAGPDPFDSSQVNDAKVPQALQTLIDAKVMQFAGLYDELIAVDLTRPDDGFANPNFGGKRLKSAILKVLPQAYRHSLTSLSAEDRPFESDRQKRVRWQVLASSSMAATAAAVPVPWLDIPVVLGIQSHMAYKIADIYQQPMTPTNWAVLSSAVGSRAAMSLGVRELLKFIPLWGMAASAASSFAMTYAMGMSADWYFADLRHGGLPDAEKLREIFIQQLKRGRELWSTESE